MNVIDGLAWLAIIYVMVAKPFAVTPAAPVSRAGARRRRADP